MTQDDRIEQKLDMIIDYFNIGKETRMPIGERKKYIEGRVIQLEERRRKREASHGTSQTSKEERENHRGQI